MSIDPVTPQEIKEDLLYANDFAQDYTYVVAGGAIAIQHHGAEGEVIGSQPLTFNIGKFVAVAQ